jgi:ATP-dependent protease ClpP protease subunit
MAQTQQLPATIYATLAGPVDQSMVQRVFQSGAVAINSGVKTLHLLFHSNGGMVGDGITLYNYFRNIPIDLHIYNAGSVSSIGVIAFLGAHNRYASANATFVIHKTRFNPGTPTDAERARGMADAMKIDDARTLDILKANLSLSEGELERYRISELPFDAQVALACGLITKISDFMPGAGQVVSNI